MKRGFLSIVIALASGACLEPPSQAKGDASAQGGGDASTRPGLVARYRMDELVEGIVDDDAGGHDGACTVCPMQIAGRSGGAYEFDGAGDHIVIPDHDDFHTPQAGTIAAWIFQSDFQLGAVMSKPGVSNTNSWLIYLQNDQVALETTGPHFIATPISDPLDRWIHVAATWEGQAVRLYVDGALIADAVAPPIEFNDSDVHIGVDADPALVLPLRGALDEVRIYGRALTMEEIASLAGDG